MKKNFILLSLIGNLLYAQTPTVGLIEKQLGVADGYTVLSPLFGQANNSKTYLLNNCGEVVHQWQHSSLPGLSAKILPNGNLLRPYSIPHPTINAGGFAGGIQLIDFNGTLLWDYVVATSTSNPHHEVTPLPNGNILVLIWDYKDSLECVAKGRNPLNLTSGGIWSDKIVELHPIFPDSAEIVWEWDNWDHLVQNFDSILPSYGQPSNHPELFDINYLGWSGGGADWLHTNAIDYNSKLDQIAISSRLFHEIYIIDHSTNTQEAASGSGGLSNKGGNILFRWGNPEAYGKTTHPVHRLFAQHNVHWIEDSLTDAGKLMIFNNGSGRTPVEYSSIDIINTNVDSLGHYALNTNGTFGPDSAEWSYVSSNPTDFHSQFIAGAQRLKNGNTLICDGTHGTIFEIDPNKQMVWKYISPVTPNGLISQGQTPSQFPVHGTNNWVFRALKYDTNYLAFAGKNLQPIGFVELNANPQSGCNFSVSIRDKEEIENNIVLFPNPSSNVLNIEGITQMHKIKIINMFGEVQNVNSLDSETGFTSIAINSFASGTYHLQISGNNKIQNFVFVKID